MYERVGELGGHRRRVREMGRRKTDEPKSFPPNVKGLM